MDVDLLRSYCNALPAVTEDIKWDNDLCFMVGGKMFCVTSLDGPSRTSFKVTDEEFEELSTREGFSPAPYMARAKWVLVTPQARLRKKDWEFFIRQSYELVKTRLTRKARRDLGLD